MYLSQELGPKQAKCDCPKKALNCGKSVEPMTGIEPAYSAWEVGPGCRWTFPLVA